MIGKRCMLKSHKGTVRYEGEVAGTEGIWYGIEWDESRGKHNGALNGVQYFECKANHGSFVKPSKVEFGVTFAEAMYERYGGDYKIVEEDFYVRGESDQITMVKPIGFDKIETGEGALIKLKIADLCEMKLSTAGDLEGNKAKAIVKLNLSKNLLSSWEDVLKIATALPELRVLNISENYITQHTDEMSDSKCSRVEEILFNYVDADCDMVLTMLKYFPGVKELHFCFNRVSYISPELATFNNLELVNFEGNKITSWDDIMRFSQLPNLKTLVLNDNSISNISIPDDGSVFQALKSLSLNANAISQWNSINCLNHLKSLNEIRLKENPVVKALSSLDGRLQIIARLRKATVVNGSPVGKKERQTAELTYLKQYAREWHDEVKNKALDDVSVVDFSCKFPNYLDYVLDYGAPVWDGKSKGSRLVDKLILLKFKCKDTTVQNESVKKVPVTMTVLQLKALLQRLFKIRQMEQILAKYDSEDEIEIPLDDNLRQLSYYGVTHDDTVVIKKI